MSDELTLPIAVPIATLTTFCRENHITKMSLFGSVLRDDFHADSDIDILVVFEDGHTPGWEFISMEKRLSDIMGRKVDLNTLGFLSDTFRDDVRKQAVAIYERKR